MKSQAKSAITQKFCDIEASGLPEILAKRFLIFQMNITPATIYGWENGKEPEDKHIRLLNQIEILAKRTKDKNVLCNSFQKAINGEIDIRLKKITPDFGA